MIAKESGLVFNSDKRYIKTYSITFVGRKHDASGVHPDPERVADLHNMATPNGKKELPTFLSLRFIQFLVPFIPNRSNRSSALREP